MPITSCLFSGKKDFSGFTLGEKLSVPCQPLLPRSKAFPQDRNWPANKCKVMLSHYIFLWFLQKKRKHRALYLNSVTFANTCLLILFGCKGKCENPRDVGGKRETSKVSLFLAQWYICKEAIQVFRLTNEENNKTFKNRCKDETRKYSLNAQHSSSHTISTQ